MRTLKFRAWDKIGNRMAEVKSLATKTIDTDEYVVVRDASGESVDSLFTDYEVMQFTGMVDKNGIDIYEGDVVKNNDLDWEIYWKDCGWSMRQIGKETNQYIFLVEHPYSEIIGNIYENPELLEVK